MRSSTIIYDIGFVDVIFRDRESTRQREPVPADDGNYVVSVSQLQSAPAEGKSPGLERRETLQRGEKMDHRRSPGTVGTPVIKQQPVQCFYGTGRG